MIDRWKRVVACNCDKEDELDYDRKDEESRLPERLRNLGIMHIDDERMSGTAREDEDCCDDQDRCWHDVSCTTEKRWSSLGEPFGHAERIHLGIGPKGGCWGVIHVCRSMICRS
jgi:hypothetical protein